jgi:Sulfotransferase family
LAIGNSPSSIARAGMIISHEHKFIFLKTKKTAGTSLELALRSLCGDDDVITPIHEDRWGATGEVRGPQHWRRHGWWQSSRPLGRRPVFKRVARDLGYYDHMPAAEARALLGDDRIWNSYFKFAFDRNPWDRQISHYYFRSRGRKFFKPSFRDYMHRDWRARLNNYEIYTIDGDVCVDFVGRYETLERDFARALAQIGLSFKRPLPRAKTAFRAGPRSYQRYYDDDTRALVAGWYAPEIALLDYRF